MEFSIITQKIKYFCDIIIIIFISRPSWVGHMGVAVSLFNSQVPIFSLFSFFSLFFRENKLKKTEETEKTEVFLKRSFHKKCKVNCVVAGFVCMCPLCDPDRQQYGIYPIRPIPHPSTYRYVSHTTSRTSLCEQSSNGANFVTNTIMILLLIVIFKKINET